LLALGISGLFRVLTPGTDWIATVPAGDEADHAGDHRADHRDYVEADVASEAACLAGYVKPLLKGPNGAALRVSACIALCESAKITPATRENIFRSISDHPTVDGISRPSVLADTTASEALP
jgi:hypothetical protein